MGPLMISQKVNLNIQGLPAAAPARTVRSTVHVNYSATQYSQNRGL
jgi:hypothetical protein